MTSAGSIVLDATSTGRTKHPYGRRNTFLHPYVRHGLGYFTVDWEESLTIKFRNLPSRERRLYSLTLGYGLRDNHGKRRNNKRPLPSMLRSHAIALMARCHELLAYGGRTIEGIFDALGADPSGVNLEVYRSALEHISARAGTGVPTGRAEEALASLCRCGDNLWRFLESFFAGVVDADGIPQTSHPGEQAVSGSDDGPRQTPPSPALSEEQDPATELGRRNGQESKSGVSMENQTALGDAVPFLSLSQLSSGILAFRSRQGNQDHGVEEALVQDLADFLYLEGHTTIALAALRAIVDKYGLWALERERRQARDEKAKMTEASKRAEAGEAFTLSPTQLDSVINFLDPNKDGHIDFQELMHAFKKERSAISILSKDDTRLKSLQKQSITEVTVSENSAQGLSEKQRPASEIGDAGGSDYRGNCSGKEERELFTVQEADELTAFLVESQQAFSLINVADIQRGLRGAKRAGAQQAARGVYRAAVRRLVTDMQATGLMVPESDDGWTRWFDMCELGLRAGGQSGSKRLVGRKELKRGLRVLSAVPRKDAEVEKNDDDSVGGKPLNPATNPSGQRWSEREVDDLLEGLGMGREDGEAVIGGDAGTDPDFTEEAFRQSLTFALDDDGGQVERDLAAGLRVSPLCERLELHLKEKGTRLIDLFGRMVAWTKDASEEDLVYPTPAVDSLEPSTVSIQRGDNSCVPPAALRHTLISLKTGGATVVERAKAKEAQRLSAKAEDDRRAAESITAEAAKQLADAERSGASAVLSLLQSSITAKGIRIIDLFRALDTSNDGLISRKELKEGLQAIAEGSKDASSQEQIRKDYRKRKNSQVARESEERERQGVARLRQRVTAAEGSGAAKVLRRIEEHLTRTGQKVAGMFHSFSLRGDVDLTTAELEMALSLVDGLDLTRREVRSVVRFLDKDSSGTVDIAELDQAVRDFRTLSRESPSLGAGPMTVVDPRDLDRLARYSFRQMLRQFSERRHGSRSNCSIYDGGNRCSENDNEFVNSNLPASPMKQMDLGEDIGHCDGGDGDKRTGLAAKAGYMTGVEGTDDLPFVGNAKGMPEEKCKDVCDEETADKDRVEDNAYVSRTGMATVTVSAITAAFEDAAREFKANKHVGGDDSVGALRDNPGVIYPSTDTRQAQASVDKVMEWLRSSRTFDRAPTGRVPTLSEKMTERQKMEAELQNKLQEKRRREAGQRHWEQWVASKRVLLGPNTCRLSGSGNDPGDGKDGNIGGKWRQQEGERLETELRRKAQDEAFEAWAREKDRLLRERRREKRRESSAMRSSSSLESINSKLREARSVTSHGTPSRFPHLVGGAESTSINQSTSQQECCSSLGSPGTKRSRRSRAPSKTERKAFDLAATRVAVSPYRVGAKEQYEHEKHIEGADIVAAMVRNPSAPLPRALVQEGWDVTSQLLGSASISRILHLPSEQSSPSGRRLSSRHGSNDTLKESIVQDSTSKYPIVKDNRGKGSTKKQIGQRRRRAGRRRSRHVPLARPVAPDPNFHRSVSNENGGKRRGVVEESDVLSTNAAGGVNDEETSGVARQREEERRKKPRDGNRTPSSDKEKAVECRDNPHQVIVDRGRPQEARGGTPSRAGRGSPTKGRDEAGVRPDGRRGNSRGAPDGEGGRGGDGMAGEFQRPEGIRRRDSGESMEFPIQSQALPDWADTIKDLPVDDPYEEDEDDFEADEE